MKVRSKLCCMHDAEEQTGLAATVCLNSCQGLFTCASRRTAGQLLLGRRIRGFDVCR